MVKKKRNVKSVRKYPQLLLYNLPLRKAVLTHKRWFMEKSNWNVASLKEKLSKLIQRWKLRGIKKTRFKGILWVSK